MEKRMSLNKGMKRICIKPKIKKFLNKIKEKRMI